MRSLTIAPQAQKDAKSLLRYSQGRFGSEARARYARLLFTVYNDLRADPERHGVRSADALAPRLRLYHLRHSRSHVPASERVGTPRHILAFRADDDQLFIFRVLHESMDLASHVGPGL